MEFTEEALRLGSVKLSYSKLSTGKKCGFKFNEQYLKKTRTTNIVDSAAAIVGVTVHSALEWALAELTTTQALARGEGILLDAAMVVRKSLSKAIDSKPLTTGEKAQVEGFYENIYTMVLRLLRFIVQSRAHVYTEIGLAIASDFSPVAMSERENIFFSGIIDLVLVMPNGDVAVIDHKTGYKTLSGHEDQLKAYEVLVHFALTPIVKRDLGVDIATVRAGLNFVQDCEIIWSETTPAEILSTERRRWFTDWVNTVSKNVSDAKIGRGRHCHWCGYRELCGSRVGLKKKQATSGVAV